MTRAILLSAASLFTLCATSPAPARDQPASAAPRAADQDDGEIVVTAQLCERRISEVPIAVTACPAEFMRDLRGLIENPLKMLSSR